VLVRIPPELAPLHTDFSLLDEIGALRDKGGHGMNKQVACPVCQAHEPKTEFTVETIPEGEVELQICGKCGVVYTADGLPTYIKR
jgi:hypothetical protein